MRLEVFQLTPSTHREHRCPPRPPMCGPVDTCRPVQASSQALNTNAHSRFTCGRFREARGDLALAQPSKYEDDTAALRHSTSDSPGRPRVHR